MEPEGSLPFSQEPATVPYPQPDHFSPYHAILSKIHSNIILLPLTEWSQFESLSGVGIFSFPRRPERLWGPLSPPPHPIGIGGYFPRLELEAYRSRPTSAEVKKNFDLDILTPLYAFMA
jgi:hypothetical protein